MKRIVKVLVTAVAGLALIASATTTTAQAASKVKVLSTTKIAKRAVHATSGNVYSSAKLTHRKYQMKHYKNTTWYTYKQSVIKKKGKTRTYVYIKSGKKKGWIYNKSLKNGKAVNKKARLLTTYVKYNKIARTAGKAIRYNLNVSEASYYGMGNNIYFQYNFPVPDEDKVSEYKADRKALLKFYDLFKNRFKGNTRKNLDRMATDLRKQTIKKATMDQTAAQMENLASTLGDLVENLS
ncbi:hypothetical protein D1831_08295 [Lactiplantibacillus garii]|uniref:D-alanyl-D-alanine carboxypeptidase n=1 Tax=Lactiplantibacillus garii TaxID=2306423 RepID=A0A3R8L0S3_9LACO|nr:hypothetical protein [Lactiplantibacillus garii]RRK10308.1 hypothetical protein D1831_08295 [Lactiplantibacillus garii]